MAEEGIGCGKPTGARVGEAVPEEHINEEKTQEKEAEDLLHCPDF
jgi:hypothetical protein